MQDRMRFNSCSHLEICGGCQSNPGEVYEAFLKRKMVPIDRLTEKFAAKAQVSTPSKTEFYRVKVEWRLRLGEGAIRLGYFQDGSREFFAIRECPVLHPLLLDFFNWLSSQTIPSSVVASARLVVQLFDDQSKISVILISEDEVSELEELLSISPLVSYFSRREHIRADTLLPHGRSGAKETSIRPGQFIQSHCEAEQTLRDTVWSLLKQEEVTDFEELFCGNGHLSLGYEGSVRGYDVEILAADSQGDSDHRYVKMDLYRDLPDDHKEWRNIVADPGRPGLKGLVEKIARLEKIINFVYVSCNHESLEVDVPILLSAGFEIKSWQVLDLFPWTMHWEMVLHLKRKR